MADETDKTPGLVSRIDQVNKALQEVDEYAKKRLDFLLNAGLEYNIACQLVANAVVHQQVKIMEVF